LVDTASSSTKETQSQFSIFFCWKQRLAFHLTENKAEKVAKDETFTSEGTFETTDLKLVDLICLTIFKSSDKCHLSVQSVHQFSDS
jgi:hypothetical protein